MSAGAARGAGVGAGADPEAELHGLAAAVVALARRAGVRLAVAESLTGGLLASALVGVPGASLVFSGGVVAYDTALKRSLLGVDGALLRDRGPVDATVARQMAAGVRRACAVPDAARPGAPARPADVGVATTGVAGPDPDPQTGQPAGTVWIGLSSSAGDAAVPLRLAGDRAEIRTAAVAAALRHLADRVAASGEAASDRGSET